MLVGFIGLTAVKIEAEKIEKESSGRLGSQENCYEAIKSFKPNDKSFL